MKKYRHKKTWSIATYSELWAYEVEGHPFKIWSVFIEDSQDREEIGQEEPLL